MDGGEGDDVFYVDNIGDVVKEAVGGGSDKIIFQLYSDFVLASGVEVEAIELVGSDNNNLTGNEFGQLLEGSAGRNKLMGQGGNDTLDGGGADGDTLEGGEGNDVYILQTAATIVNEALNQGTDTIVTDFTYSIENRENVENLTLVGSADIDGTGSSLDNYLTGNDNDNDLFGLAGDDTLDGGLGTDSLAGGLGNDYYLFNQLSDLLMEDIDEGTDTVASKFDHTLAENFENLILTGFGTVGTGNGANNELTGNKLANTLTGLAGNDTLDGGGGDDTMVGGTGNDYYLVSDPGDVVTELANEGTDTVASQIDYVLGATLENLVLTGPATKGTGNATNNKLTGNGLGNVLKGGAGSDTIDGGAGTDSVVGGSGNDSYVLGNGHDVVTDSSGTDDRITSTISRNLANYTGIENLTLVGTGTVNGTGNAAANDLIGNAAANKLSGGAGNDLLRGMNGADLLTGGSGRDTFDFNTIIEIGKGAGQRDIVRDFKHGIDTLDLGAIDADTTKSGNQKFKFVATEGAAFTGIKGQLTWDQKNYAGTDKDMTLVSGDINGDGIADFRIELRGLVSLTAGDFIL
jgi:Ca2+-binding RTX toxin-like protein